MKIITLITVIMSLSIGGALPLEAVHLGARAYAEGGPRATSEQRVKASEHRLPFWKGWFARRGAQSAKPSPAPRARVRRSRLARAASALVALSLLMPPYAGADLPPPPKLDVSRYQTHPAPTLEPPKLDLPAYQGAPSYSYQAPQTKAPVKSYQEQRREAEQRRAQALKQQRKREFSEARQLTVSFNRVLRRAEAEDFRIAGVSGGVNNMLGVVLAGAAAMGANVIPPAGCQGQAVIAKAWLENEPGIVLRGWRFDKRSTHRFDASGWVKYLPGSGYHWVVKAVAPSGAEFLIDAHGGLLDHWTSRHNALYPYGDR